MPANPSPSATTWEQRWKTLRRNLADHRRKCRHYANDQKNLVLASDCRVVSAFIDNVLETMTHLAKPSSGRKGRERDDDRLNELLTQAADALAAQRERTWQPIETDTLTRAVAWSYVEQAVKEADPEGVLNAMATWLEADLAAEKAHAAKQGQPIHAGIESALQSAIDGVRHAAMDYYVSTK